MYHTLSQPNTVLHLEVPTIRLPAFMHYLHVTLRDINSQGRILSVTTCVIFSAHSGH